jgi:hypothetical protein
VVHLHGPDLEERLATAIRAAWAQAPDVRGPLRERALAQISASRQGFERAFAVVGGGLTECIGPGLADDIQRRNNI